MQLMAIVGDDEGRKSFSRLRATAMAGATERIAHIAECRPEICTLDCGTMNFAEADYVMTNTPGMLRAMAKLMTEGTHRQKLGAVGFFGYKCPDEVAAPYVDALGAILQAFYFAKLLLGRRRAAVEAHEKQKRAEHRGPSSRHRESSFFERAS